MSNIAALDPSLEVYEWRNTGPLTFKCDADTAGRIFDKIKRRDGKLTPEAVVKAAAPKNSPLHDDFLWDNDLAAKKYREGQARTMIAAIYVTRKVDKEETKTRAFLNVVTGDKKTDRGYLDVDSVMRDTYSAQSIIRSALNSLQYWLRQYRVYSHLSADFTSAISGVEAVTKQLQDSIAEKAEETVKTAKKKKAKKKTAKE